MGGTKIPECKIRGDRKKFYVQEKGSPYIISKEKN